MSRTRQAEEEDGQGATTAMPPRVIIEQPNGSIDMGVDFSRVPKETHRANSDVTEESDAGGAAAVAEEFARAQEEERRLHTLVYENFQRTTLRTRRNIFLSLVVTDFLFFSGVLIYQMVVRQGQQPASPRERASIMGQDTLIPVSWWINIPGIKLEDIIFSMVLDLLGVIGALHNRTSILSLFILLEALCTALLTLAGVSLFHVFRLVLLVSAFYLRSALITASVFAEAVADGTLRVHQQGRPLLRPFAPVIGFFAIMFGQADRTATVMVPPQQQQQQQQQDPNRERTQAEDQVIRSLQLSTLSNSRRQREQQQREQEQQQQQQQDEVMQTSSAAAEAQQPTAAAAPAGGGGAGTAQGSQPAGSANEQVAISMPTSAAAAIGPQQPQPQRSGPLGWLRRNRSTGAAEALPTASSDSALRRWHTGPPHLVTLQSVPSGGSSSGAGLPSAYSAVYAVHQPGSNRGGQDSQPWPHSNNLQQIYIMQMSQLAESANAAAMLSTHSGLRFAEPPPGPSNWAGTGGGSSSSRPPAHNSSSGNGGQQ